MTTTEHPVRRWLFIVVAGVLAFLAWRVISLGIADHYAESDPAKALKWRSDHPEALLRLAERKARKPEAAEEAAELARRALRANPLDGRPYRVLGQLAAANGDREGATKLMLIAATRSPRDVPTLTWLVDYHLSREEFTPAMAHIDLLLRAEPELQPKLQPMLTALAQFPPAQPAFAERLAMSPPWRLRTVMFVLRDAKDVEALVPLMDTLRRTGGGLPPPELNAWVDRLAREGRAGPAYLTWVSQLPKEQLGRLGNIYNGSFESEPTQGGFDWRFLRIAGARVERVAEPGATGRLALRVAFDERRVPFSHVRQMLALSPGNYRLSGQVRLHNLRTERGLVWQLTCNPSGKLVGRTDPMSGQSPWRPFSVDFEIPAEGCSGQWLMLALPARIPAEQRIGGTVLFDDLRIARRR